MSAQDRHTIHLDDGALPKQHQSRFSRKVVNSVQREWERERLGEKERERERDYLKFGGAAGSLRYSCICSKAFDLFPVILYHAF